MAAAMIPDATLRALVRDAATALSVRNTQPWRFVYHRDSGSLDVRVDTAGSGPGVADVSRARRIDCGAALFNLRVAAAHAGLPLEVDTTPDLADPDLVARVRPGPEGVRPDAVLGRLYPALAERHRSSRIVTDAPVSAGLRDELTREVEAEGAHLVFPSDKRARFLMDVMADNHSEAELGEVPGSGAAPSPVSRPHTSPHEPSETAVERRPALATLSTVADNPQDWVVAGQAVERVMLAATLAHLATATATSPSDRASLRWLMNGPAGSDGPVQALVRLGRGPAGRATSRRPVEKILDIF
ncbi:hypothetical protein [Streptomyces sp. NRRL F-5630]|uniref:hypothetical protein n=1 Tax=unclassified Streptomyces TaxID=2593676 RepID=UPI0004C6CADC|nr:hypothetical protein [Streptomyces sp. NRRL F-5630]